MDAVTSNQNGLFIALTDFSGVCPILQANSLKANGDTLVFSFFSPLEPGTLSYPADIDVEYTEYDSTCQDTSSNDATGTSGTVTITSADSCSVVGTFDVMLDSGDHITGSFTAPRCAPPATDAGATGCM